MTSWAEDPRLAAEVAAHPYPLLFATVSGAHLYGFPSADSDFDLRGVHLLRSDECLGLDEPEETVTLSHLRDGIEIDLVTHDAKWTTGSPSLSCYKLIVFFPAARLLLHRPDGARPAGGD